MRIFVRSKHQISHDKPNATGRRSTEDECILEFGKEKWAKMLEEMDDFGAAILPENEIKND